MAEPDLPHPLTRSLGALAGDLWPPLARRYAEPHRHYHDVEHIEELAQWFQVVAGGPGWTSPTEVALAVLFHDAIYEPQRPDNEERSAALALDVLASSSADSERVAQLIRLTARHGEDLGDVSADLDAAHFLDADMAILGADPRRFLRYQRDVRAEYVARIPEDVFDAGRRRFLEGLLGATIYLTPLFRDRLAVQAQRNIERALSS